MIVSKQAAENVSPSSSLTDPSSRGTCTCSMRVKRNCELRSEEQQKEQLKGSLLKFRSRGVVAEPLQSGATARSFPIYPDQAWHGAVLTDDFT